ncbi:MAG: ribose 5-phosphate isomerase B [Mogibacterium sp.]|nr:ribose 5-phosphate isomerase B [Mogibacterium sp.]MBR2539902.1 ribose 5-phosphate isomerase B [Mogibacterium sp.]
MKIVIGSDHAAYELKEAVKAKLEAEGYEMIDVGTNSTESVDYPKFGHAVGKAVASGEADKGIAICGTGIGISIAANKVPGIRAGVVHNVWTAEMTKAHNDANVLCFGARVVDQETAFAMVDAWLNTEFMGDKHLRRINEIEDLDF